MDGWMKLQKINGAIKKPLRKDPTIRKLLLQWQNSPAQKQLNLSLNTDLDILIYEICQCSYQQKSTIEQAYEQLRMQEHELWETLQFNERKHFWDLQAETLYQPMKRFVSDGSIIRIAFFSPLLNALYDHELPVFELPQFYKLYRSFHDECVHVLDYGRLPFDAGMSQATCLAQKDQKMVLWLADRRRVLLVDHQKQSIVLDLSVGIDEEVVAEYLISGTLNELVRYLSEHTEQKQMVKD